MIHITVEKQGEDYRRIVSEGHALYDEEGSDIVCAGVSALLINAVNSLDQLTQDGIVVDEGGEEGGFLSLELELPQSGEARLLLDSLMLGLDSISENYGKAFLTIDVVTKAPWETE